MEFGIIGTDQVEWIVISNTGHSQDRLEMYRSYSMVIIGVRFCLSVPWAEISVPFLLAVRFLISRSAISDARTTRFVYSTERTRRKPLYWRLLWAILDTTITDVKFENSLNAGNLGSSTRRSHHHKQHDPDTTTTTTTISQTGTTWFQQTTTQH